MLLKSLFEMIKRLGIFGGTFDPVHAAHLICARHVASEAGLDRVLLVPCRVPPHKHGREPAYGRLRLEMIQRSIEGDPVLQASDMEIRRDGPSYSLITVQQAQEEHPAAELFFILGSDAFAEIRTWYRYEELLGLVNVLVMTRPGSAIPSPNDLGLAGYDKDPSAPGLWRGPSSRTIGPVSVPLLDISSSDIRARIKDNRPIRYLVPDPAIEIIERNALYR